MQTANFMHFKDIKK